MRRARKSGGAGSTALRVLMLLENSRFPGDSRVVQEAKTLVAAGCDVSVISPRRTGQSWRETVDGVRVYRFPAPVGSSGAAGYIYEYAGAMVAMFVISLALCIRRNFDVVHAHNPPDTLFLIGAIYKAFGKRFVFDHHDLAPELYLARFGNQGNTAIYRTLVQLEKWSCSFADQVIAANESHKILEMDRGGVPEKRITVVRNGPDLDLWQPTVPPLELGQGKRTVIAYGGVMGFQDGIDRLIKALRHLIHDLQRTDVICVIAGDGDALPSLKTLAADLSVDEYVIFTGWLEEELLVRTLAASDICVEPVESNSYSDRSTMIKIMNYMALGKPVIAFDLPEHRFTAQDAAVYVQPNDEVALAAAIALLIDDPQRQNELGSLGRRRVEEELAWTYSAAALLQAYQNLETAAE